MISNCENSYQQSHISYSVHNEGFSGSFTVLYILKPKTDE